MGLDLYFDAAAFKAIPGVDFKSMPNSTPKELEMALRYSAYDTDYIEWLKEETPVFRIPDYPYWREYSEGQEVFIVRANKWGDFYTPLTNLLKEHGIEWEEF